jgi:predicted GNAT family N-acyltransferase
LKTDDREFIYVESAKDLKECLALREEIFIKEQKASNEYDDYDLNEKSACHFLLKYEGQPVGTARLRERDGFIKFERICVLKSFRGKSLGEFLMVNLQKWAINRFPNAFFFMHAQTHCLEFYRKLSWKDFGDTFFEEGICHNRMLFIPDNISLDKVLSSLSFLEDNDFESLKIVINS